MAFEITNYIKLRCWVIKIAILSDTFLTITYLSKMPEMLSLKSSIFYYEFVVKTNNIFLDTKGKIHQRKKMPSKKSSQAVDL